MCMQLREPDENVRRRARVLAWRIMQGELVRADFNDPAWNYVAQGITVPHGAASGSFP